MSKLLEMLGRAITVDTADLIWHWFGAMKSGGDMSTDIEEIVEDLGNIELDKAGQKLKFHLLENPGSIYGKIAASVVHLHRNELEKAIEQLQSVYLRKPNNTIVLYALGHCHERLGNEAEAIEFYQDCIKFKRYLQLPVQRMAAIYFKNGELDKAAQQYEILTTEHPKDISSFQLLGYLYMACREYGKAIDTFNTAINNHPDNLCDDNDPCNVDELVLARRYDEAIGQIQWLIDDMGEESHLFLKMGDILKKANRVHGAIDYFEKAIKIQPMFLEPTIKLGTAYLRIKRPKLAAEQFNRAVEINDEIIDSYLGLMMAQAFSGKQDEAIKTLRTASAINQNSTLLFGEAATLNFNFIRAESPGSYSRSKIEDVIKAHIEYLGHKNNQHNADVKYRMGMLEMCGEGLSEAKAYFQEVLEAEPWNYRARSKLAMCLYEEGKAEEAVDALLSENGPVIIDREKTILDSRYLELLYKNSLLFINKAEYGIRLERENKKFPVVGRAEAALISMGIIDRAIVNWDGLTETAQYALNKT